MKMELPTPVLHSLFALNEAGYEAYVVGGCVRDSLMGNEPKDWDITTSALPEETLKIFQDYRTIETGIQHGTVMAIVDGLQLEITTFRVDGAYSDGRHPDVVSFTHSLTEDLRRRDFTINAMAYHPSIGLIDPFDGEKDLQSKIIRCVGDPIVRFTEDALRILRGLRFSATLNFTIAPTTAQAIHQFTSTLPLVSTERITAELCRLLCGDNVKQICNEFPDVLEQIFPCRPNYAALAANATAIEPAPVARLGVLLFELSPETVLSFSKQLRLSRQMSNALVALVEKKAIIVSTEDSDILYLLNQLGPDLAKVFVSIRGVYDHQDYTEVLNRIDLLITTNACYTIKQLAINGNDLINYGIAPGPNIGVQLNLLLDAVISGVCANKKEDLLAYIKEKSLC